MSSLNREESKIYAKESAEKLDKLKHSELSETDYAELSADITKTVLQHENKYTDSQIVEFAQQINLDQSLAASFLEEIVKNGGHEPSPHNYGVMEVNNFLEQKIKELSDPQPSKEPKRIIKIPRQNYP